MRAELEVNSAIEHIGEYDNEQKIDTTVYLLKIDQDNLRQLIAELTDALNDYDSCSTTMASINLPNHKMLHFKKDY